MIRTTKTIPPWWTEPTYDKYCDPTALPGAGTGTGTAVSPYTDLQAAFTALTTGQKLGIRTGRTLDLSSLVDLNSTAALISLNSKAGITLGAWRPSGAPDDPSILQSAKLIGTSPANWIEIDYKPLSVPGTQVNLVGQPGVFAPLNGSGVWQFQGTMGTTQQIRGVGYNVRDSISDVVNESNYKQHGPEAPHVQIGWLEDSGTNTIVSLQAGERTEFTQDMQWLQTGQAKLLVKSSLNPASRWGGVYVYQGNSPCLSILNCTDLVWRYALQAQYTGHFLRVQNSNNVTNSSSLIGLYGSHVAQIPAFVTTNQWTKTSGPDKGTADLSAGTNTTTLGDGTSPILQVAVDDVQFDHIYSTTFWAGWLRNCDFRNLNLSMGNLQSNGTLISINTFAPMGSDNRLHNFLFNRIHCGAGKFGLTDVGIDMATFTGSLAIYDGEFRTCAGTLQLASGHRNQTCFRVKFIDCLHGPQIGDECSDGNASHQVVNCSFVGSDPAGWKISAYPTTSNDWANCLAYDCTEDIGYPARGHRDDTDTMSKNDGAFFTNNYGVFGNSPAAAFYLFRNATVGAASRAGPWDDSETSTARQYGNNLLWQLLRHLDWVAEVDQPTEFHTANDQIGRNGQPVALGQAQIRVQTLPNVTNMGVDPGCIAGQRIVDGNHATTVVQTITGLTTTAPALSSNYFLTASSPAAYRTGATVLNATSVAATIPYTRVAHNAVDMRGVPRWGTGASLGPIQYVPLAPKSRALGQFNHIFVADVPPRSRARNPQGKFVKIAALVAAVAV